MSISYTLGIDVGGTTADFAVVDAQEALLHWHKELIQESSEKSILDGIQVLLSKKKINPDYCQGIHLGTTLAVNSLLELKSLYPVGLLRFAGHHPDLPAAFGWPEAQRQAMLVGYETLEGGKSYDNQPISLFSEKAVLKAVEKLLAKGAKALAVVSVFSPLYAEEEKRVEKIIHQNFGDLPVSLSYTLGGLGFIERENNTLINAALQKVMGESFSHLMVEIKKMGFHAPVFVTQNNGTLFSLEEAMRFPLKTITSGPTNSLVGASKLAGVRDAIIVDVGGTSTEVGLVNNGFPQYSIKGAVVAGVPINFRLPTIEVLALGGGSILTEKKGAYVIGPESLGARVFSESLSVGGQYFTLYDVGQTLSGKASSLSYENALQVMNAAIHKIEVSVSQIASKNLLPIILVGGGAQMIPSTLLSERYVVPKYFQVANAYGAALSEISAMIDVNIALTADKTRQLKMLEEQALEKAIFNGADPSSVRIIDKNIFPYYYMADQLTRVVITAVGKKKM